VPSRKLQLDQAREHVRHTQWRIEEQTDLIASLRSDGHDTTAAELLLATFIDLLGKLALHLNQLEREAKKRPQSSN